MNDVRILSHFTHRKNAVLNAERDHGDFFGQLIRRVIVGGFADFSVGGHVKPVIQSLYIKVYFSIQAVGFSSHGNVPTLNDHGAMLVIDE
ncbi:hypothetical protein ACAN47_08925 [Serratia marcescens]|uniref:hypothetical protein n=1 Tax=Serratia marcescens TaxID=615 RepID=UPI0039907E92